MTSRVHAVLLVLLLALGLSPAALAQGDYQVEVIVFKQWEAGGPDAERWPLNPPPPAAAQVVSLADPNNGFSRLSPNQLKLHGAAQALAKSPSYEPLIHFGWRQPGLGRDAAPAVQLPADAPVQGLIRVYRERYLHVEVDLRQPTGRAATQVQGGDDGATVTAGEPVYVHQQSRRMRSGELHYLDHPALGVLVLVTPLGAEE